ncbi:MAG: GTP cyclohydrolase I [Acidisphaera sp.]|nr:GTP cyclohydrolase I [Acidisphaera sp.]
MSVSIHRLKRLALCNEALATPLADSERAQMIQAAAGKLEELFDTLQIDYRNDHNTRETPTRVAKMFVEETLSGRYSAPPRITEFDNVHGVDGLLVTGPIELRSTCAHHLMPIYGHVFIGVLPSVDSKIIGLSKYDRVVEYFASRLQIQEELVKQIGQYLVDVTAPRGLAVRVSAVHMCKTQRGVRGTHRGRMVNSAYYGEMLRDRRLKEEFLQECIGLERAPL